jgi:hypothetical protein
MNRRRNFRAWFTGTSALAAGLVAGAVAVFLTGTAVAQQTTAGQAAAPFIEATHVPPLLTMTGEQIELRYDAYCTPAAGGSAESRCAATGTVFVRAGNSGSFQTLPLGDTGNEEGRFAAVVPPSIAGSRYGFSYYAELRNEATGASTTLPTAGASAPQRSLPMDRMAVSVSLGTHPFGNAVAADERVAETTWGTGPGQVGLEEGRNDMPIGGSSFDVDADSRVHLLDEANRRLLTFGAGGGTPTSVPLGINGTIADLAVASGGHIHVLESVGDGNGGGPLLRSFAPGGGPAGAVEVAEGSSQVLMGQNGLVVHEQVSGQWMSATVAGQPLSLSEQRASGQIGRPMGPGRQAVVLRTGNEIRLALVEAGAARRSWRLVSSTPVAEVQLAEAVGDRLVVVARMYTDTEDEFLALVLGAGGVEQRIAIASNDWAETAPLSRFRLVGSSLYRLGSTPETVFVDRFDLEVS